VRNTKAAVDREFSSGPDLSRWHRMSVKTEATFFPAAANRVPHSLRDPTTGMKLVLVPGACYRTDEAEGQSAEVCLAPYYIGAFEATFDEYDRFARATNRRPLDD